MCDCCARASGGALAPEPAARDRGRTAGPVDFSELIFLLFLALFWRSDVSPIRNRTSRLSDFILDV